MAKYQVTFKCGCTKEVELFGSMDSREWKLERMAEEECFECRTKKINEESIQAQEKRGLSNLSGSEKQIQWATTLRENAYRALDRIIPYATTDDAKKMIAQWDTVMASKTEAKWWIDNRFSIPKAFVLETDKKSEMSAVKWIVSDFARMLND